VHRLCAQIRNKDCQHVYLIAGGTGITPMLQVVQSHLNTARDAAAAAAAASHSDAEEYGQHTAKVSIHALTSTVAIENLLLAHEQW
jgi:ferredoxin-NADP reductase